MNARDAALVVAARDSLDAGLAVLADAGIRVPCSVDPDAFTSDEPELRRLATKVCARCPIAEACRSYADAAAEPYHVWGGQDRAPRARGSRVGGGR